MATSRSKAMAMALACFCLGASITSASAFSIWTACEPRVHSLPLVSIRPQVVHSTVDGDLRGCRRAFLRQSVSFAVPLWVPGVAFAAEKASSKAAPKVEKRASGLQLQDVVVGQGAEVVPGSKVTFHYIGRLAGRQGKPFEDTYLDEPVRVQLGTDNIIKGLEEGLVGMREGSKRRMLIPSEIGYLDKSVGPIPRSFGNRQRLYSTVLNTERTVREREALGSDIAGKVLLDVEVIRVRPPQGQ